MPKLRDIVQKCQGHARQGETKGLTQIRGNKEKSQMQFGILDKILKEQKDIGGKPENSSRICSLVKSIVLTLIFWS